jgi:hypothetical protein
MVEKPRTSWKKVSSTGGLPGFSPAGRWIRFYAALLLAFILGSTAHIPPAQAAQTADVVRWYMDIANPKTKICVGDTVEYLTKVFFVFNPESRDEWPIPGVKVEATSSDKSVGSFKRDSAIAGFGNDDLVTASFLFTAKKTGTSNLYFEGMVDKKFRDTYVSFTVPVTVINCKYKVTSRSQWMQNTGNGTVFLNTYLINVRLVGNEQGHFTVSGSSNATWIMTTFIPGFRSSNTIQSSEADLDGQLFENNQFSLNLSLNSTSGAETNCGEPGCGGGDVKLTADPIKLTFPAEGGTRRVPHGLNSPGGKLTGSSVVTLKVEKP